MKTSIGPQLAGHAADHDMLAASSGGGGGGGGATIQAVTATFSNGVLTTFGDNLDNTTVISRDAAGRLLVNGGAVAVTGGTPTVANTELIQVFGLGGDDVITLNEANGALPRANLFGGAGNDVLTGGSGADLLFGQADNDVLLGKGGADALFGGSGNDTLTGGDADDQMFGEAGDDRFIWNPGDDTDLVEGGSGIDTVEVNGGNGAETFTVTPNGTRVRVDRVTPAPFSIDAGTVEKIVINANGGDDVVTASNGLAPLVQLTIDGGTGNDSITGGDGADLLLGGDGNDLIVGGRGADVALLGAGDDRLVWNPGDGDDVVEGQGGSDTLAFNGANVGETIDISANGGRTRFLRNIANITMDLNDVERIEFQALGGADNITVNDLSGTDVAEVRLNLGAAGGGGDLAVDTVTVNTTNGAETVEVFGAAGSLSVVGALALVSLQNVEATDQLVVRGLGGDDRLNAATLAADAVKLTLDGGAGNDELTGGRGADLLLGGDGNDRVIGGQGDDVALMGAGDDRFVWNPGDGSDVVEGQDGADRLVFNGSNAAERIDLVANGTRALFLRDVANVRMDLNGVERIDFQALGGADTITIGDLSGTGVGTVALNLLGPVANGDAAVDTVTVNGGAGNERIVAMQAGTETVIGGLSAQVRIAGLEAADSLQINGGAGNDTIDTSALAAGTGTLTLNGGLGNDLLIGGAGNDLVVGGDGDDVALLGAGDDVFVWNPGDDNDVVEGQGGSDTLAFNGANVAETIDIAANGGRVRFFRNIANVTMDLNDVETLDFAALGGADNVNVGDLSGTDLRELHIDLGAAGGSGDAQRDTVTVSGTQGDDTIVLTMQDGDLVVEGLAARLVIEDFEAGDVLRIAGLGGDDLIDARGLGGLGMSLVLDGGAGNDVLLGSARDDVMFGADGDDVLLGDAGDDVLDGGAGDDVLVGGLGTDVLLNGEVNLPLTSGPQPGLL